MKLQLLIALIVFLAIIKPVIADQGNSEVPTVTTSEDGEATTDMKESADATGATAGNGMSYVPEGSTVENSFQMPNGMPITTWITPDGSKLTTTGPVTFTKNTDEPKTIKNTDGSITAINSDGAMITKNIDGSITTIMPDSSVTTKYPDGSMITKNIDGSATVKDVKGSIMQFGAAPTAKNADGSITTKNPDGSTITQNPDGSVTVTDAKGSTSKFWTAANTENVIYSTTTVNADGTITTVNADGSIITQNLDGSVTVNDTNGSTLRFPGVSARRKPGGTITTKNADGSTTTRNRDGSITTVHTDGSETTDYTDCDCECPIRNADGSYTKENDDGSIEVYSIDDDTSEETTTTIYPDGSETTEIPDGSKLTRGTDGSLTVKDEGNSEIMCAPPIPPELSILNDDGSITSEDEFSTSTTRELDGGIKEREIEYKGGIFTRIEREYPDGTSDAITRTDDCRVGRYEGRDGTITDVVVTDRAIVTSTTKTDGTEIVETEWFDGRPKETKTIKPAKDDKHQSETEDKHTHIEPKKSDTPALAPLEPCKPDNKSKESTDKGKFPIGKVPVEYPKGKTPQSSVKFTDIPQPQKK